MMCRLNFDEPHMVVTENQTLNTCNHVFVTSDIFFKDEGVRPTINAKTQKLDGLSEVTLVVVHLG